MWLQLVNVELAACCPVRQLSQLLPLPHIVVYPLGMPSSLFPLPPPSPYLPLFAGKYEKHNMEPSSV